MATDSKYFKNFPCFRDLSAEHLEKLAQISDALCYPPDHTLFQEGQPGDRLIFLVKGEVEVFYNIGEDGKARVDTVADEEMIGCAALVEPFTYTATERSLTEVEVLEIDAEALRRLMKEDCLLGFSIQQKVISFLMDRILNLRLAS